MAKPKMTHVFQEGEVVLYCHAPLRCPIYNCGIKRFVFEPGAEIKIVKVLPNEAGKTSYRVRYGNYDLEFVMPGSWLESKTQHRSRKLDGIQSHVGEELA